LYRTVGRVRVPYTLQKCLCRMNQSNPIAGFSSRAVLESWGRRTTTATNTTVDARLFLVLLLFPFFVESSEKALDSADDPSYLRYVYKRVIIVRE
jgi:hypothetical protein